jgi:hypothetical protein
VQKFLGLIVPGGSNLKRRKATYAPCFDVVFDVINRSAVQDYTICEGDFDRMVEGLTEIKEIITTGKINGKSVTKINNLPLIVHLII